ncbi:unnamed protein product, partial [Gordionus sp. m RMFG-2023]
CKRPVSQTGRHCLQCIFSSGRSIRHNRCNALIKRALQSAGFPATLEPSGLFTDGRRPDGITQIPWENGRFLAWDFSCVDPLSPSNINKDILKYTEDFKRNKYVDIPDEYKFVPVVTTTLTSLGSQALSLIKKIGRTLRTKSGDPKEGVYLRQRIGIQIIKSNFTCFIGSFPGEPD